MEFNATFLVSAISFIIFVYLMNMVFYKPLTRIITERQNFLDDTYNEAKKSRANAAQMLQERDERLKQSSEEAKKLMSKRVNIANSSAKTQTSRAKEKSSEDIKSAKYSLSQESEQTKEDLKDKILDLAESIAAKVLDEEVKIDNLDKDRILL